MIIGHWSPPVNPGQTPRKKGPVPLDRVKPPAIPLQRRNSIPPHPFGADVRSVSCKVLKSAIRAVLSRWGKRPRSTGEDEVSELLGLDASAIHQARSVATANAP